MLSFLLCLKVKLFDCFVVVFVVKKKLNCVNNLINCIIFVDYCNKIMILLYYFFCNK